MGFGSRWLALSILLLLSMSSIGCLGKHPETPLPPMPTPQSECHDGNVEEWSGFNAIVQVARDQKTKGDEYHVAAATEWIGQILMACFPDRFQPAPPPVEVPASAPPSDASSSSAPSETEPTAAAQ